MAGIYIHIPFCKQACHYCNFHFTTSLRYKNEMVAALLKEIELRKEYPGNESVETIYFGGGTPSLCTMDEIRLLMEKIQSCFPVSPHAEITFEANPDDISEQRLKDWITLGINRLSIGIQSFFQEDLQWMNRAHTADQSINSLKLAVNYFDNITIDLIYGTPQMTGEKWKKNVETAIGSGIPHLSCYALTVEPKTALARMIKQHRSENIDPDKQAAQFLLLMQWMEESGYEQYEISNFCKPGWRSRHNSSYWSIGTGGQGKKYVGIGPSAHSFNGHERQWNIANNTIYRESISKNIIPFEKEILTPEQKLNEFIMTSLRTIEGLALDKTDRNKREIILTAAKKYIDTELMKLQNNSLVLTKEGKLLADGIASALFF